MREQKRKRRRGLRSDLDRDAITTRERKINKNRFHANSRVSFRNKTATKWMKTIFVNFSFSCGYGIPIQITA